MNIFENKNIKTIICHIYQLSFILYSIIPISIFILVIYGYIYGVSSNIFERYYCDLIFGFKSIPISISYFILIFTFNYLKYYVLLLTIQIIMKLYLKGNLNNNIELNFISKYGFKKKNLIIVKLLIYLLIFLYLISFYSISFY